MARNTAQDEQVREHVDHIDGFQLPVHPNGQALARELVDDVEHAELAPVMGAILNKVIRPDMIRILGPQADAGSVVEPEPSFLRLPLRHFEPLPSPDPLDPLLVHEPAGLPQQGRDAPVAITAVLGRHGDDVGRQPCLIVSSLRDAPLRRAMLSEHAAHPPLGQLQGRPDVLDAGAATGGAQKFPEAASFRICLSRVRSATARRSLAFSASRSFRRLT